MLGFQGSLQFDGFVHHRHSALLFELVYELVTRPGGRLCRGRPRSFWNKVSQSQAVRFFPKPPQH